MTSHMRKCLECGSQFESSRFRATCSPICARTRRRRQYRDAAANRSAASLSLDKTRKSTPEYREKHAANERTRRAENKTPPRTPYADLTDEQKRNIRASQRDW